VAERDDLLVHDHVLAERDGLTGLRRAGPAGRQDKGGKAEDGQGTAHGQRIRERVESISSLVVITLLFIS
jgi:hypothetical protein